MARSPGDEDQARFLDNEYYIAIDDADKFRVTANEIKVPNIPILSASVAVRVLSASTSQTTLTSVQHFVVADATAANFGIVLPSAATVAGRSYTVKKVDASANIVYLSGAGSDKIDGNAIKGIASHNGSVTVTSDGQGWRITNFFSASTLWV